MAVLVAGLILFFLPHSLREFGMRDALMARFSSPSAWKAAYSLVSLSGFGLIIWGKSMAPFVMIWEPPFGLRWVSHFIMLPVFWMILAGVGPASGTRRYLRNPMLLGVTLWGAAHLWANGDLASMLLFGGFTLWGIVKYFSLWHVVEASHATQASHATSGLWYRDVAYALLGLVLYFTLFVFHGDLFGVGMVL